MKFKTKAVEIEAVQWLKPGDHPAVQRHGADDTGREMYSMSTRSGRAIVRPGDWIITEPDGNGHYPCAPDVFETKYEAVSS